jgi:hypothetical protein
VGLEGMEFKEDSGIKFDNTYQLLRSHRMGVSSGQYSGIL